LVEIFELKSFLLLDSVEGRYYTLQGSGQFGSRISQTATPPPTNAAKIKTPTNSPDAGGVELGISSASVGVGCMAVGINAVGNEMEGVIGALVAAGAGVAGKARVGVAGAG